MKISASLIIKNEEKMLPKCLKSIKGVDEIIVVDTGSEDKSIEIAKKAGAKVFTDYKWNDHFSEARNESKKHCTGDWLLIIDGDEILNTTIPTIRELLKQPFMKEREAIMFYVDTGRETNEQIRMFRNSSNIQWVGAAHNLPYIITPQGPQRMSEIQSSTFQIKANFSPNHIVDPDRTLRIMTKELAKGPQALGMNQYTRYLYYAAREHMNRQDTYAIIVLLEEYVGVAMPTNEMADAYFLLATCYADLGHRFNNPRFGEKAVDACLQTIKYQPTFKAAYALVHNLANATMKPFWEKMFHMANNEGVLFKRPDAEILMKPKK